MKGLVTIGWRSACCAALALCIGAPATAKAKKPDIFYSLGVPNPECTPGQSVGIAIRAEAAKFSENLDWAATAFEGVRTKTIRVNKAGSVQDSVIPDRGTSALGQHIAQAGADGKTGQRLTYLLNLDLLGCYGLHGIDRVSGTWAISGSSPVLKVEASGQKKPEADNPGFGIEGRSWASALAGSDGQDGNLQIHVDHATVTDIGGKSHVWDLPLNLTVWANLVPSGAAPLASNPDGQEP